jgi:hypothetical protein
MSWKKYFKVYSVGQPNATPSESPLSDAGGSGITAKFSSYLPEVYAGHPNRIQRYYQYDDMDRDSDINAALDTIADFCTQSEEQSENPFQIHFNEQANETEVKLLKTLMDKWTKKNNFKSRLWHIFRNTIKFGDSFFLRDPETGEWLWVDHYSVMMVKIDEEKGKTPDEYIVRGLDYNKQAQFATTKVDPSAYTPLGSQSAYTSRAPGVPMSASNFALPGANIDPRTQRYNRSGVQDAHVVDAKHIVHLSLSVGMDINWPFGQSVLECVYKTFKQKEMLEDAVLIYRVSRAPERRIFKIDTGQMPPNKQKAALQAIKNEIHQRRIPNRTGGGASIMDAAYNPLAIMEDYFFAVSADGRGSSVETLPGGDNLGEIGDLSFFTKKLARGLRIPPSYLSMDDQSQISFNDGKLGAALIQEFRFNKYCMRIQSLLAPIFDSEFKKFVRDNGINIDTMLFELQFNPPQNFTKYRQIELDAAQASVYQQVADNKKLSERFKLKRFLNLTEEELLENERLWAEENAARIKSKVGASPAETDEGANLSSVGIRPTDSFDMGLGAPEEPAPDFDQTPAMTTAPMGGQGNATGGTEPTEQ